MGTDTRHILLVEDNPGHAELIRRAFETRKDEFNVINAPNLAQARKHLVGSPTPTLVIADWRLPDGDGLDLLDIASPIQRIPLILMTSHGNERVAVESIKAGALDYVVKSEAIMLDMPHIVDRALRDWKNTLERERAEADLRRLAQAAAIWNTVGKTVVSAQDLQEILATVIQVIKINMPVEDGTIWLRNDADELYFAKTLHENEKEYTDIRIPLGQGIAGWVAQNAQTALIVDVSQDSRFWNTLDSLTNMTTRSVLCVPLIIRERTIGVIELLNKIDGAFNADDQALLESIAAPVAIAIQNATLHAQVQDQLTTVTDLLNKVEAAKHEWELTIDAIEEGIMMVDENCRIMRANRALAEWLNTTPNDLVGQYCYRAIYGQETPLAYCQNAKSSITHAPLSEWELEQPNLGGMFRFTTYALRDETGAYSGSVNVLKNITVEKQLEAQMIQSQKLSATGRLAATLAHEINNPLQAIQGCLDLAHANLNDASKQQRYLAMATAELERLAAIVQRMLEFNRPAKSTQEKIDAHKVIDDVLALSAKRLQHGKIVIRTEWETNVPYVHGNANQLQQVFLNLILNAIEAMPNGGELRIRGRIIGEKGHWAAISITDTGVGIEPGNLDKIFEPFYTTKTEGSGLGLSVCHNIVTNHGGRIDVESIVGHGSTFTVQLPF
jgi:signal transduction histidine kinase/DNA-binding NarL/FixJ family response regulator